MIAAVLDYPLHVAVGLARGLRRALHALDTRSHSGEVMRSEIIAPAVPPERFRWESDMLAPVARAVETLAPWLRAPGAVVAEVPAAVGIVDLLAVRFDQRSLRHRAEAGIAPVLSPLRVRVLHALLDGRRWPLDELAAMVGSRPAALMRSTLVPLEAAELVELDGSMVRSSGMWLPAGDRVVAIELKLAKWRDALNQADNFTRSADQSWVVLDAARATGAAQAADEFSERGVGLAAVTPDGEVDVLLPPGRTRPEGWLRALIAERALAAASHAPIPEAPSRPPASRPQSEPRAVALVS